MSKKQINDGGAAFPVYATPDSGTCDKDVREALCGAPAFNIGMTIRDYFAAKAMQGFAANDSLLSAGTFDAENREVSMKNIAECSYRWADAMLAARSGAPK